MKVKSRAKFEKVEKAGDTHLIVSVQEPPVDGKANLAVIKALAEYFNVKRSSISLVAGQTSRHKVFEVAA